MNSTESYPDGGLAMVVGAGGIGQAMVEELGRKGRFDQVLGLSRSSDPAIDITVEDSVVRAAEVVAAIPLDLRLVVDATGFLHDEDFMPEKSWRQIDPKHMARAFAVNAIGPALLMKHFLPLLSRSGRSVFATLSARVGSIGDNRLGGWYSYRASKAALNQLVRTAAIELRRSAPEAICVALHPGTVDTPLSQPFGKSGLNVRSPENAAEGIHAVMRVLGAEDSGCFIDYAGKPVLW
jgi:NAD(P)-dependent dehydrogenase (short-subunit alcohol dehydrogenase family)